MRRIYRYLIFILVLLGSLALDRAGVEIKSEAFFFLTLLLLTLFTRPGAGNVSPIEEENPGRPRWWLHAVLLAVAFLTTTWAGGLQQGVDLLRTPGRFPVGLPYSVALLAILGAHEIGHQIAARRRGQRPSPPYFIPVPFALGTFGAFVNLKGAASTRNEVLAVAEAGPLAGLAVAVPALAVGLLRSTVAAGQSFAGRGNFADLHSSLFLAGFARLVRPDAAAAGHHLELSPLAFAAWIGIFITALNLVPMAQLDGGHIAHAMWGRRHGHAAAVGAVWSLVVLGFVVWPGFLTWAIIGYYLAGTHDVVPRDDVTPPSCGRRLVAWCLFALAAVVLLPVPTRVLEGLGIHSPYF